MPTILDGNDWMEVSQEQVAKLLNAGKIEFLRERDEDEDAEGPIYVPTGELTVKELAKEVE